jgi:hypothetical protein
MDSGTLLGYYCLGYCMGERFTVALILCRACRNYRWDSNDLLCCNKIAESEAVVSVSGSKC